MGVVGLGSLLVDGEVGLGVCLGRGMAPVLGVSGLLSWFLSRPEPGVDALCPPRRDHGRLGGGRSLPRNEERVVDHASTQRETEPADAVWRDDLQNNVIVVAVLRFRCLRCSEGEVAGRQDVFFV